MSDKPVREHDKFMLRLPDGMRERLKEEAAKNKRSLNAEIIARLEESFPDPEAEARWHDERYQERLQMEKDETKRLLADLAERLEFIESQLKKP